MISLKDLEKIFRDKMDKDDCACHLVDYGCSWCTWTDGMFDLLQKAKEFVKNET